MGGGVEGGAGIKKMYMLSAGHCTLLLRESIFTQTIGIGSRFRVHIGHSCTPSLTQGSRLPLSPPHASAAGPGARTTLG